MFKIWYGEFMPYLFAVLLAGLLMLFPCEIIAEDPTPTIAADSAVNNERSKLEGKIAEYQRKLEETRQQKNTLASQLEYLDTQAYVTELRITATEDKIKTVEKEAELLTSRIGTLDQKLDVQ